MYFVSLKVSHIGGHRVLLSGCCLGGMSSELVCGGRVIDLQRAIRDGGIDGHGVSVPFVRTIGA